MGRIKEILLEMDVNAMTPVECLMRLNKLRKLEEVAVTRLSKFYKFGMLWPST